MRAPISSIAQAALLFALSAEPAFAAQPLVYVALGGSCEGSALVGDPARLATHLERMGVRVQLADLTAPDATVATVREAQLLRGTALRPALVTVAVGPREVLGTWSLRKFQRDLQIVSDLLHRTTATVVLATLPRARELRAGAGPEFKWRVDAFNWAIIRMARRHDFILADVRRGPRGPSRTWADAVRRALDQAYPPPGNAAPGLRDPLASRAVR